MAGKLLNTKRGKTLKLLFFVVAIFVLGMIIYFPDYSRLRELRRENQELLNRIDKLETEIEDYQIRSQRLKKDSFIYEEIARDRLGVAREGEIIVDIEE